MNNNELIQQARKCTVCMIGASESTRKSCKADALGKTYGRANQSALNYQQKCRDVAEIEAELEKAKEFSDDKIKLCDKLYEQLSIEISRLEQYESELTKLKESGFCATCTGCNAPHDPDKITWCMDWEYKRK